MAYLGPGVLVALAVGATVVVMRVVPWRYSRQQNSKIERKSDQKILEGQSLLDLWKYFEDRGASVKNTMLSTLTWVTALVAAVFGFAVKSSLSTSTVGQSASDPYLGLVSSLVGIGLVLYADVLIWDFGDHIQRNFDRADLTREGGHGFDEILGLNPGASELDLPRICKRLRLAFWGFCFGFTFLAFMNMALLLKLL